MPEPEEGGDRRPTINDGHGVVSAIVWLIVALIGMFCGALTLAVTLVGAPLWDRDRHIYHWIAGLWARSVMTFGFIHVDRRGFEHAHGGPFIVAPNHQSNVDLLALYLLPVPYRTVVKRAWFYSPLALNIWLAGYIPTHRSADRDAPAQLLRRAARWLDRGISVLMFPEGTRAKGWTTLRFRRGPFELAAAAGVPVLPVALAGTNDVSHPSSWRFAFHKRVIIEVLPPIAAKGDGRALRDACRAALRERVEALRAELAAAGQGPRPSSE